MVAFFKKEGALLMILAPAIKGSLTPPMTIIAYTMLSYLNVNF